MGALAPLFDTNILIDCLGGHPAALREVEYAVDRSISVICWMEVMAGATPGRDAEVREFLDAFKLLPITSAVAERAVLIRRTSRLKLPDALILATAQVENRMLVTRNTRDFAEAQPGVRIPYRL